MPSASCPVCGARLPPGEACAACALEAALFGGGEAGPPALEAPPPPFDPTQLPGRFGPYLVERELAGGGMGIVYAARDTRSGAEIALKLLRFAYLAGPEEQARFRTEGLAVARLEHPHLVRIHDLGTHGGQPFLAMERLDGGSLAERLRHGRPLPLREAASIVAKVAAAVHHAHQRGVLHRDLKPSNILFDKAGEPRLCDFGLAKLADDQDSFTLSSAQMGTPPYMSPEQAAGRTREVSTASDVWALGAILFHALAGRVPFSGGSPGEIFRRILEAEPPPLRGSSSGRADGVRIDRDLESICLRCLEKNPAKRLASAGEVSEELRRWLDGKPIRTRAVGSRERAWRWAKRHPFGVAAGLAIALSLAAGSIASTILWRRAEAARVKAEENAYFAGVGSALIARERSDFGLARRTLLGLDPARRGFEWRLLQWLTRGDEERRYDYPADVRALDWSPARGQVAVLGADRRLSWLDPISSARSEGPVLPRPTRFAEEPPVDFGFHALAVSPDGKVVAAGDHDLLVVVDAETGALLHHDVARRVQIVWLDNDRLLFAGNLAMAAGPREHASIFDRRTGRCTRLEKGFLGPLALSPDRSLLAGMRMLGEDRYQIEIRPAAQVDAGPAQVVEAINDSFIHVAFSADSRHLAYVTNDDAAYSRQIHVVALANGGEVFRQAVPRFINQLIFHPSEPELCVVTEDATVRTYRYLQYPGPSYDDDCQPGLAQPVPSGGPQQPPLQLLTRGAQNGRAHFFLGHEERVGAAVYLPNGTLLTGSADCTVRRWPARPSVVGQRIHPLHTSYQWEHPTCSADGRFVLALVGENQAEWRDRLTELRKPLPPLESPVAVLRDGSPITRHPETALLTVWEPASDGTFRPRYQIPTVPSHQPGFGMVMRARLSADERTLGVLIPGKVISVNLAERSASGTRDQRMLYGNSGLTGMDFSADGRTMAVTGLLGRHARLYQAGNVNGGHVMLGEGPVFDTVAAFHPDGRRVFVGNEEGVVRVFDLATQSELPAERWRAQSNAVTALAISADGRTIATSGDHTLRLWDGGSPAAPDARRERFRAAVPAARNWIRFAEADRALLHAAPNYPLEVWGVGER